MVYNRITISIARMARLRFVAGSAGDLPCRSVPIAC
jgi:hypothetical protein